MMAVKNGEITPDLIEWLVADPEVGQKEVDNSFLITFKPKHRKNCECCPGHSLIVNHYSSMS